MRLVKVTMGGLILLVSAGTAMAQLSQGTPFPEIKAKDLKNESVDIAALAAAQGRKVVIVHFFTPASGEAMAHKLRLLDRRHGGKEIEILAIGMETDEAILKAFSEDMGLEYHIVSRTSLENAPWLDSVTALPLTLFVRTDENKIIDTVLRGGGSTQADFLRTVAEKFFQQGAAEDAVALAEESVANGESEAASRELKGYALALSGRLDDAEQEFAAIDSKTGLAKVALDRGEFETAIAKATESGDAYAQTIIAEAQLRVGNTDAAATAAAEATKLAAGTGDDAAPSWQRADAFTVQGRVAQETGDTAAAVKDYREAQALDPYDVVPLSNEAEVHRSEGKLDEAKAVLEKAGQVRPEDDLTKMLLARVEEQLQEQTDVERRKVIQGQIADLSERFKTGQAAGTAPADNWTSRPLVLAFLPSTQAKGVFFDRVGTDVALQREIEVSLQSGGKVSVVDRQVLDQLLQELNLGSSELASADTQRRLGQVLSAGLLGVLEFAQVGPDTVLYLRLIDTETTQIVHQISEPVNESALRANVTSIAENILTKVAQDKPLQGLIADAAAPDSVLINLGGKHGVTAGQVFNIIVDGEPVEAGGKVIAYRPKKVGTLEVTTVETDYSVCTATLSDAGVTLAKDMKVRQSK
jgi:tetratricopeptide (TPR) repeat protein